MPLCMKAGLSEDAIIALLCGEFGGIGTAILQNAMRATSHKDVVPEIRTTHQEVINFRSHEGAIPEMKPSLQGAVNSTSHEGTNPETKITPQKATNPTSREGTTLEIKNQNSADEGSAPRDSTQMGEAALFPGRRIPLGWHIDIEHADETLRWVINTAAVASVLEKLNNSI